MAPVVALILPAMTSTSFVESDGVRLAYDVAGSGPPLVLLHAGIVDRRMWDGVVPLLTGLVGWCPPYAMLGISTCQTRR